MSLSTRRTKGEEGSAVRSRRGERGEKKRGSLSSGLMRKNVPFCTTKGKETVFQGQLNNKLRKKVSESLKGISFSKKSVG